MGCNCKRRMDIEDKYGEKIEENLLEKGLRLILKVMVFALAIALSIVITPFLLIYIAYKMIFKHSTTLAMPKQIVRAIQKSPQI